MVNESLTLSLIASRCTHWGTRWSDIQILGISVAGYSLASVLGVVETLNGLSKVISHKHAPLGVWTWHNRHERCEQCLDGAR